MGIISRSKVSFRLTHRHIITQTVSGFMSAKEKGQTVSDQFSFENMQDGTRFLTHLSYMYLPVNSPAFAVFPG